MSKRRVPGGRILLRVPQGLHGELISHAQTEGVSLNQYLVSLLSRAMGAPSGEEPPQLDTSLAQEAYGFAERLESQLEDLEQTARRLRSHDLARISDLERGFLILDKGSAVEASEGLLGGLQADPFASDSRVHQELREEQALRARIAERARHPEPQVDES